MLNTNNFRLFLMIIFKKKLKLVSTETFCTNNLNSTVLTNYNKQDE